MKYVKTELVKWGFKANLYFTQEDAVFKLFGIYSVRKSVRSRSPDEITGVVSLLLKGSAIRQWTKGSASSLKLIAPRHSAILLQQLKQ